MSFLNLPVRTLVAACGLSLLSLAAHADSFRGDAHAPQQAAVATPHPAATVAGLETLANGGNAFDAAAAIAAALAVAEPYGSGLGGGGFFLLRQAGAQPTYRFLDARERAPKAAYADMYRRNGKVDPRLSVDGPLAAAIPGLPAALVELSSRYGRKPLADNLVPAIRLAVDGISVDRIYRDRAAMRLEAMRKDPETARIFLDKGGIPDEWYLLRQPQLARTLERLGRYGRIGFYEGETADKLLTGVRAGGGIWSAADLRDYRVIERRPLEVKLANGRELISAPPPSAGGVALAQSLQMLEQLPWQKAEPVQRAHYVLEVLRRAYRDRGLLGDPDFVANPLPSLLAPDYLKRLAAGIDPRRATTTSTSRTSSSTNRAPSAMPRPPNCAGAAISSNAWSAATATSRCSTGTSAAAASTPPATRAGSATRLCPWRRKRSRGRTEQTRDSAQKMLDDLTQIGAA